MFEVKIMNVCKYSNCVQIVEYINCVYQDSDNIDRNKQNISNRPSCTPDIDKQCTKLTIVIIKDADVYSELENGCNYIANN